MTIVADQHQVPDVVKAFGFFGEWAPPARTICGKGIDVRHLRDVHPLLRHRGLVEESVAVAELTARRRPAPKLTFDEAAYLSRDFLRPVKDLGAYYS